MEKILKKQLVELERIRKLSTLELAEKVVDDKKSDEHFTSLEKSSDKEIKLDQDMADSLKKIEKSLGEGLAADDLKSLSSNLAKLHERIKKQTEMFEETIKMSPERAKELTDQSMGRDQFKTIGEKVGNFKESFKDFFTLKGFLNKTGLISEKSEGIIATAVNKRDARKKYAEDRMSMDFEKDRASIEEKTPRKENESKKDYEKRLKKVAKESYESDFNKSQDIKKEQRVNERTIKRLEERGFTREQISRRNDNLYAKREALASQLAQVDERYAEKQQQKPESRNAKDAKKQQKQESPILPSVSSAPTATSVAVPATPDVTVKLPEYTQKSAEIIPFPSKKDGEVSISSATSFSDEGQLESMRMQETQIDLLEKIEENTRGLSGLINAGGDKPTSAPAEGEGSSLLDMIPGKGILGGAARLGKKILGGARAAAGGVARAGAAGLRFAGTPMGMKLGGALAVAGGAYTAYKGWTGAEEEKQAELARIDEAVASGEITQEEAKKQKEALGETTVEKKSTAVGEGTGMAAGAIGGAKLGATIGTFFGGPIGTGVGALAGGALGAFAGSKAGQVVGEYAGKGINYGKKAITSIGEKVSGYVDQARDFGSRAVTTGREAVTNFVDKAKDYGTKAISMGREAVSNVGEKVSGYVDQARDFGSRAVTTGKETLGVISDKAKDYGTKAISMGREAVSNVGEKVSGFLDSTKSLFGFGPSTVDVKKSQIDKAIVSPSTIATPVVPTITSPSIPTTKVQSSADSSQVYSPSKQNATMASEKKSTPAPVIVNAPTTNVSNSKQSIAVPTPVRNDDSSLDKYFSNRAVFL